MTTINSKMFGRPELNDKLVTLSLMLTQILIFLIDLKRLYVFFTAFYNDFYPLQ